MSRAVRFVAVFATLAAITAPFVGASAAESPVLDRIVERGEMRVGISGNQPPFNAKNRTGNLIGIDIDFSNLIGGAMGVEVTFVEKAFPELLPALEAGELDIVISGVSITPGRTRSLSFVGPYMLSGKAILTKSATLAKATEAADINQPSVTLVALRNSTSQEFVELVLPQCKLLTSENYDSAVTMVLDGEVDAMVADMPICMLSVLRNPDAGLAVTTEPLTIEPIGVAISAEDPQFENLLENYLRTFEGMGIMEELRSKWLDDGSWIASLP